jgi:hypothetical protein
MLRKFLFGFLLLFVGYASAQNPVEQFYEAFNNKNWKKFNFLLHKDFKCIVADGKGVSRKQFYNNMYADDVWFAEWKILNMEKTSNDCYLIQGTFTDEYSMFLYGAPVEGLWTYCVKNRKVSSIEWHDFPENPNQKRGDEREKEFRDWITLNYPEYSGISIYWSHDYAKIFKALFYKYKKGRE